MNLSSTPARAGSLPCVPLPALLARAAVVVVVYVFVLVLLRWGYDTQTALLLVSVLSVVAVRTGHGLLRAPRSGPSISASR